MDTDQPLRLAIPTTNSPALLTVSKIALIAKGCGGQATNGPDRKRRRRIYVVVSILIRVSSCPFVVCIPYSWLA